MAQELRFTLDGSVYDGGNAENFGITVSEEPTLGYRYVSYDNDLQFTGAAYAYLNGLITGSCGCDLVEVRVDYKCGGTFTMLCMGYIILSECITNLDKCQITTKLYDDTFSTLINNNKSIPFSLQSESTKNGNAITPCTQYAVDMFVPATGVYDTTNFVYGVKAADAIAHIVGCMTDNRVDVNTPVFDSGTYEWLMLMTGRQILSPQSKVETILSFEQLFLALQKKIDISISTTLQDNGRPLITIDLTSNINALSSSAQLVDVAGVVRSNSTQSMYSIVNFGNDNVYEQWECNGGDNACTFAQTPFYGFRDETFGLIGNCNKDLTLDLVVRDVIFDTNIIEDIFVWGNQSFSENPIVVMCEETLIPSIVQAKQYDPYSIGQTVYNGLFNNKTTSFNFISSVPNFINIYGQAYDWNNSITTVQNQRVSPVWQTWNTLFPDFTGFLQFTGDFFLMENVITDAGNNWINDNEYRVPFPGLYTVNLKIVMVNTGVSHPSLSGYASVMHYNSNDELIKEYDWTNSPDPIVTDPAGFGVVVTRTVDFIANAGDYIRANAYGTCNVPATGVTFAIDKNTGTDFTEMFVLGQPIIDTDNFPDYNPCDFKRYLYDFEYPLPMSDIASIVQQPSAPIRFSRTPTINAGISGTINKLNVSSVIRQMANFTIRSKDIL